MEEGTLVQIPSEIDKAFARYIGVLDADGVDPRELSDLDGEPSHSSLARHEPQHSRGAIHGRRVPRDRR